MLKQKAFLIYFTFIIIAALSLFIKNSMDTAHQSWLESLPSEEKMLYELEQLVVSTNSDINMTKAEQYFEKRRHYCKSFQDEKLFLMCQQRTLPWWNDIYREQTQH